MTQIPPNKPEPWLKQALESVRRKKEEEQEKERVYVDFCVYKNVKEEPKPTKPKKEAYKGRLLGTEEDLKL